MLGESTGRAQLSQGLNMTANMTIPGIVGSVLHPGVLIADSSGDILFWNAEARAALESLGNAGCLDDLFDADALERLFGKREWLTVKPRGAAGVWRVRARRLLDSGRSLVFFFADEVPQPRLIQTPT
jgi:hypothetical protein